MRRVSFDFTSTDVAYHVAAVAANTREELLVHNGEQMILHLDVDPRAGDKNASHYYAYVRGMYTPVPVLPIGGDYGLLPQLVPTVCVMGAGTFAPRELPQYVTVRYCTAAVSACTNGKYSPGFWGLLPSGELEKFDLE